MVTKKQKILVVDDEQSIRTLILRMLGKHYTVVEASDGADALKLLKKEKPELILLDIFMPQINGYSFLGNMRDQKEDNDIPVIMISAVDHDLNKTLGRMMGAKEYLSKPFTSEELLGTVKKYLPCG